MNVFPFDHASARKQIAVMLRMQDEMNKMVAEDWRTRGFAWHRAIYIEAGEFLEHLGTWKWWKKGSPDMAQAKMELVDIWHFALSMMMVQANHSIDLDTLAASIATRLQGYCRETDLVTDENAFSRAEIVSFCNEQVDRLVAIAGDRGFNLSAFVNLLGLCSMDFDSLFRSYVGKNMLNRFRQSNGYKEGTYIKIWAGEEDNVHLERILSGLPTDESLPFALYSSLESTYTLLCVA